VDNMPIDINTVSFFAFLAIILLIVYFWTRTGR
jgi:hypothetical protein